MYTFQLGVHRVLAEALALNLTADYLGLSSLHVPSACFLHLWSTSSSNMRFWLVFSTMFSARCAPIPRPEALALNLTADYLCLSSFRVPSACFLHICSTSSSYMMPWLVFFYKTNSARCAPIPRRSPRVESCGWLSVFVVFTCSFCLFLTH